MNTLVLIQNKNNYFFPYVELENVDVCECYLGKSTFYKIVKRIPGIAWFAFSKWKYNIDKYDNVILFDSIYCKQLGKFLSRKVCKKAYVYSWNSSIYHGQEELLCNAKKYFKVYSFDKNDCEKFGLSYAPMVYSRDAINNSYEEIEYDIMFVGKDKGRVDYLHNLYMELKKQNLKCYFYILGSKRQEYECEDFVFSSEYLSYDQNVKLLKKSKAVLDIQQSGQEGITIRVVEAIFYGKKIITSKLDIDKYDLYSKNNIFILNRDSIIEMTDFLNKPMDNLSENILNKYDFKYWIQNIVMEK